MWTSPSPTANNAGLDSSPQTAGRRNREGRNEPADSLVYCFRLDGQAAPQMLAQNISAMNYAARRHADLSSPEAIKSLFQRAFQPPRP